MVEISTDLAQSLIKFLDLSQNNYNTDLGDCLIVFKAIFNSGFQLYIGGGNCRTIENHRPVASH